MNTARRRPADLRSHRRHGAKDLRGYGALCARHIPQANDGCDFDFLEAGGATEEPEIH